MTNVASCQKQAYLAWSRRYGGAIMEETYYLVTSGLDTESD